LHDSGRVEFVNATDDEALAAVKRLATTEGIIPALESSHAAAHAIKLAPTLSNDKIIVVNVSEEEIRIYLFSPKHSKIKNFINL